MARKVSSFEPHQIQDILGGYHFADDFTDGVVAIHEDYKDDQKIWSEVFTRFFSEKGLKKKYRPLGPVRSQPLHQNDREDTRSGVDFVRDKFGPLAGTTLQFTAKGGHKVSIRLVICVDSDSRYLYEKPWYLNRDFVFHTYAYSIESFNCYGELLDKEIANFSLGKFPVIQFTDLLREISHRLAAFFCYRVHFFENRLTEGIQPYVGNNVMKQILNLEIFCQDNSNQLVDNIHTEVVLELSRRANEAIEELEKVFGKILNEQEIKDMLLNFEASHQIFQDELHLYLRGHSIFEKLILPLAIHQIKYLETCFLNEATFNRDNPEVPIIKSRFKNALTEIPIILNTLYRDSIAQKLRPIDKLFADLHRHQWD